MNTYTTKEVIESFGITLYTIENLKRPDKRKGNEALIKPINKTHKGVTCKWSEHQVKLMATWVCLQDELKKLKDEMKKSHKV